MEFQHKENAIPEWRLELKNAVRQKLQKDQGAVGDPELFPAPRVINRTVGATALKTEYVEEIEEDRRFSRKSESSKRSPANRTITSKILSG